MKNIALVWILLLLGLIVWGFDRRFTELEEQFEIQISELEARVNAIEQSDTVLYEFIRREHFPDLPIPADSVLKDITK